MDQDSEDGLGHALRSQVEFTHPSSSERNGQQQCQPTNMARELFQAFGRHSNKVLLVDTASGRQWTGSKLREYCARLATGLANKLGLRPNDTVLTICDHNDEEIATALGVVIAGGALFGTQPTDGYAEVETLCQIVRPNVFVVNSKYHKIADMLRHQVKGLSGAKIVWLDNQKGTELSSSNGLQNGTTTKNQTPKTDDVYLVEDLIAQEADIKLVESIIYEQINAKEHMLTYMLTSGSTGRPKVVPSTHEELVYGLYSMISAATNPMPANGKLQMLMDDNNNPIERAKLLPLGPDEIVSGDLPLDHGAGLNTMFLSLWLGAKFVVMPSYDMDAFWQAVNDYQITFSIASTTFCYRLFARLKQLIERKETSKWNLSSFKFIASCGAKLAFIDLIREVQQQYPHIQVAQAYGCTEIGFISIVHLDDCSTHLNSVGNLFPGVVVKVVDYDDQSSSDRICDINERGELLVWARSKFKGYRCQPEDNASLIFANCHDARGQFYKTGDQAHLDPQGRVYIHGRFKDTLCLMEDWKILPSELEDVINEHPLVEMSAVVGVPDPNLPGCDAPKAFVKLFALDNLRKLNGSNDDDEYRKLRSRLADNDVDFVSKHIYEFVASRTARPKHLTGGVRILDEFPRVGLLNKVDRKALKLID